MAELVDALASGASGSNPVQVQVLPRAPLELLTKFYKVLYYRDWSSFFDRVP